MMAACKLIVTGAAKTRIGRVTAVKRAYFGNNSVMEAPIYSPRVRAP